MKVSYRGHEIDAHREKCLAGYSLLYFSVYRESDGLECVCGYEDSAEKTRDMVEILKRRVDAELASPNPWSEVDEMSSNYPPDFDSDADSGIHEDCVSLEDAAKCFTSGLQSMREMLARFVEQGGDNKTAASIRANWNPSWGPDPGRPREVAKNWDECL